MKYAIIDLEIVKALPSKTDPPISGIKYCAGWTDFANMGISVAAFKRSPTDEQGEGYAPIALLHLTSIRDHIQLLQQQGYRIGGFRSRKFDDKLLQANDINFTSDFDILDLVLAAAGVHGTAYWKQGLKYNLDVITQANGMKKTGSGALAPIWWQQGDRQRVIDYCKNDTEIEAEVLELLLAGELIDPNTGAKLKTAPL